MKTKTFIYVLLSMVLLWISTVVAQDTGNSSITPESVLPPDGIPPYEFVPVGVESSRPVPGSVFIDVFPNPVVFPGSEPATIRLSLPGTTSGELVLYDRLGRKVRTVYAGRFEGTRFEQKVDVSDLPPGHYFFLLRTKEISRVKSPVVM